MIYFLQATAQRFWPTNAQGWIGLIGGVFTVSGVLLGVLSWYVRIKLNGLGRRVKSVEESCAKREGATDLLQRQQQTFEFAVAALAKDIGQLQRSVDGVRDVTAQTHLSVEQDARRWERKFARLEGKLGIPADPVTGD